ncbi:MAG: sugar transferase [Patescibacteria group bacterium]|nr:sugar transferase [Patescibacteria group bacterium]
MAVSINPYYQSSVKRILDIVISLLLLFFLLPVFLVISLLIILTSGWPVLYIQNRVGKNKKNFRMYKFRTMVKNADRLKARYVHLNQAPTPMFKIHNDPRFTKIGKWLSHSGIDELPQIINIILGNMSLVGPRPLPIKEAQKIPNHWDWRFEVKPGLFSYWSLSNNRHESLTKWKKLEKQTLEKGSITHDLRLILTTAIRQSKKIANFKQLS